MRAWLLLGLLVAGCAAPRPPGTVTGEADTEERRAICATMRGWATGNIIDMRTGLIVYRCPHD